MSQWNNSYAYNNQHQNPNTWNSDASRQQSNQPYYSNPNRQYDSSNQYVTFDEFLTQMQPSTSTSDTSYNALQYQNYPNSQYNVASYSGPPVQNSQLHYTYGSNTANFSNNLDIYQENIPSQLPQTHDLNSYPEELVYKSRLTATASEFVPKNALKPSNSSTQIEQAQDPHPASHNTKESKQTKSSSSTNWRERPTQAQNSDSYNTDTNSSNYKPQKYNGYNKHEESNSKFDSNSYYNRRDQNRYNEYNGRNGRKNRSNENSDSGYSNSDNRSDNMRYKSRNEPGNDSQESSNYSVDNLSDNVNNDENQTRNSKSRNKEPEVYRTYYNSSMPKSSQDVRNGRGESSGRGRNWAGSQRLRATDRNYMEDEQFANTYLHQREEKEREKVNTRKPKASNIIESGDVPIPIKNGTKPSPPWWDDECTLLVTQRKKAEKIYKFAMTEENLLNYMSINAKFRKLCSKRKLGWIKFCEKSAELTQRERLSDQLDKGTLECLVCCERVKQIDPVWYCSNCYHVLHLRCIRKWAMSSMVEGKWRCPACQNTSQDIPVEYRCMCGALKNPEYQRGGSGAHTCGRACKRPRNCSHPCTLLCHPGPCPPCQATINKKCGCGAETRSVLCSSKLPQVCNRQCKRKLECTVHTCSRECHEGPCEPCEEIVNQVCYCPAAKSRSVGCTAETGGKSQWSCGGECGRVAACGAHVCRARCHPAPCPPCPLRPDNVLTCPCGNTQIGKDQRKSCTDPIPLCERICAKPLPCGPAGDKHFCKDNCHEGPCRVCPETTAIQCRCGHSSREVPCSEYEHKLYNVLCQRKCNKKMSCGRHRCRTVCCDATSHRCAVVCGRTLSCQLHRCEDFCHTGHCAPCPRLGFEELRCACGKEVVLPPIRCGARPPACSAPCRRQRPCGHEPHHSCHQGDCPPCVVLTTKMCHGQHEERKTIPCSQEEFSCGMPCGKPLPCGKHTCIKTCHKGPCDAGKCTQPCRSKRPGCGHECAAACHSGPCPATAPCRRPVRATCACGRRAADRACADNARDYAKMMSTLAASKMQEGGSVDLTDVQRPGSMLKTLECDEECYVEARSRRMALALQIRNPDVSAKLAPRYSDAVRAAAAREPAFAAHVHERLTELVQLAKKSKQKTRSHSFPSMNRQKRQFIHEMCEHFGCESVAYDAEPNRNVVATADREKSWLPAMSVLEVLAREAGRRRVPGPVLRAPPPVSLSAPTHAAQAQPAPAAKPFTGWATLTSSNAWAARSQAKQEPKQEAKIDYFDNPPEA